MQDTSSRSRSIGSGERPGYKSESSVYLLILGSEAKKDELFCRCGSNERMRCGDEGFLEGGQAR